jgi:spermidine synthase
MQPITTTALVFASVAATSLAPALARAEVSAASQSPDCGTDDLIARRAPSDMQYVKGDAALVTDGTVGPEGTEWDAPVAVVLGGAGALTYDLGQPRRIGAFYLQADANDRYQVTGSLDGAPGSFRQLAEIDDVFQQGHGLRSRSVEIPPTTVRYLRVGAGTGDGFYSVSEFAAYCRAPTPFPPAMRVANAPRAPAAGPTALEPDRAEQNSRGRNALLVLAAATSLVGALASFARPRPKPRSRRRARARERVPASWSVHDRLRLMFLASGCAALIYEIVWFHLLRLVIGASALSVGIVLASFMGGMFLGSLLFARLVSPARDPLRVYGFLEIGIGVCGLSMPLLLPTVRLIYVGLVGYGAVGVALRAVIAMVLLLPPTALMGATLPAIARRYPHGSRGMSDLASLYAANTVGAVVGCLLSAFYLLSVWDVWVATFFAAALNVGVGRYALGLGRGTPEPDVPAESAREAPAHEAPRIPSVIYVGAALSGLTALAAQVVWTRLLTLLFGATVYAFAIILAVFLGGLGIGSALAARLIARGQSPLRALTWTQLGLVPAILSAGALLGWVLPYASPPSTAPPGALHVLHLLRAIDVILPAALLWGMSFPFALAAAGSGRGDTGRSSGYVYAANTGGAILGALGASFWAIPARGTQWTEQCLVVLAALSAALLFYLAPREEPPSAFMGRRYSAWAIAVGAAAAACLPGLSRVFLAHGRYIWWADARDQYPYTSEGASSTVAVHIGPDGYKNFHVSGRVEATNNPNDLRTERLIGHLSALTHPRPESVLVVGLGAGITAGAIALYPDVKRIVICEIEPRVVGAAELFDRENYGVLKDPRVDLVFDDARHFLATTRERFDIITSDPIHPWVRGNSVLFSREYYAIVSARLRPGGIASQWVPLYETSELAIQIQMQTFMQAFPHGTVWNTAITGRGYDVVLVGGAEPLRLGLSAVERRIAENARVAESLRQVTIHSAVDLFATYGTRGSDLKTWLANTPVNRDFSLKLEYISGLGLNRGEADQIYAHMVAQRSYPEDIFTGPTDMAGALRRRILGDGPARALK